MMGPIDFSFNIWKCQLLVLENQDYVSRVVSVIPRPQNPRGLFYTPDGNVLAIHTMDLTEDKEDQSTTGEGLNRLSGFLNYYIPEADLKIVRSFAGFLHFNTRDPDDYILEFPKPRFLNVIACPPAAGPAPALAFEVVKRLADQGLILAEKSNFNPYRAREPRFIHLPPEEKNRRIQANPDCGHLICRCEMVTEEEIREAIRSGATTVDEIKFRTRAGMGRCQGGFCTSRILKIMMEERGVSPQEITLKGGNSYLLVRDTKLAYS
jgi:glycerol-3-phosphate dehydrogenase